MSSKITRIGSKCMDEHRRIDYKEDGTEFDANAYRCRRYQTIKPNRFTFAGFDTAVFANNQTDAELPRERHRVYRPIKREGFDYDRMLADAIQATLIAETSDL